MAPFKSLYRERTNSTKIPVTRLDKSADSRASEFHNCLLGFDNPLCVLLYDPSVGEVRKSGIPKLWAYSIREAETMRESVIQVLQQAQDAHTWAWDWLSDIIGYIEHYADSSDLAGAGPAHQRAPSCGVHNKTETQENDG